LEIAEWGVATNHVRRKGRTSSSRVQVEAQITLDAVNSLGAVTSLESMDKAIWISSAVGQGASVEVIHDVTWETTIASIDKRTICVTEGTVSHQVIICVGRGNLASIVSSVEISRFTVIADCTSSSGVVDTIWGSYSTDTCSINESGPSTSSAIVTSDTVYAFSATDVTLAACGELSLAVSCEAN
jgi:hypothetical protein